MVERPMPSRTLVMWVRASAEFAIEHVIGSVVARRVQACREMMFWGEGGIELQEAGVAKKIGTKISRQLIEPGSGSED
jgi:hypothetical protein